jgi:hypothetical protein
MNLHEPYPNLNPPPPLSDEAAAQILQFLYHWAARFESCYYSVISESPRRTNSKHALRAASPK